MYYCGFTYSEAYRLPRSERSWFINRVVREMNNTQSQESENSQQVPMFSNMSPEMRTMIGERMSAPNKLRRP